MKKSLFLSVGLLVIFIATVASKSEANPTSSFVLASVDNENNAFDSIGYHFPSDYSHISGNGQFVAFESHVPDIVLGDHDVDLDIFVRDLMGQTTERASESTDGEGGWSASETPSLSEDGRFVTFTSSSANLVENDTNETADIFLHDRVTKETTRISISSSGKQGNNYSIFSDISSDGRFVTFESASSNLVEGDLNDKKDIFLHDVFLGTTKLISVSSSGIQANEDSRHPKISGDGNLIVFSSGADNLVSDDLQHWIYLHNVSEGTTQGILVGVNGEVPDHGAGFPDISTDGTKVVFNSSSTNLVEEDSNDNTDIFVFDLKTEANQLVSISPEGVQADAYSTFPAISGDGRYVTFHSKASTLTDDFDSVSGLYNLYRRDMVSNETTLVSPRISIAPSSMSDDGCKVVFPTIISLLSQDTNNIGDVYIYLDFDCLGMNNHHFLPLISSR